MSIENTAVEITTVAAEQAGNFFTEAAVKAGGVIGNNPVGTAIGGTLLVAGLMYSGWHCLKARKARKEAALIEALVAQRVQEALAAK
jgi:hypothetical protein